MYFCPFCRSTLTEPFKVNGPSQPACKYTCDDCHYTWLIGPDHGKCDECELRIDCLTNFGNDLAPWKAKSGWEPRYQN